MEDVQSNLIYLSGPHGSRKTSLAKAIASRHSDMIIPELYSRNIKFATNDAHRQMLKLAGRAIENFEYLSIAKANQGRIILANRCTYDVEAYNNVYRQMDWISSEVQSIYDRLNRVFFCNENSRPLAIVVNPGFDVVKRHLECRWPCSGKKWREEDMDYALLACRAYEKFKDASMLQDSRIIYIDEETDLSSIVEIDDIYISIKSLVLHHSKNNSNSYMINELERQILR